MRITARPGLGIRGSCRPDWTPCLSPSRTQNLEASQAGGEATLRPHLSSLRQQAVNAIRHPPEVALQMPTGDATSRGMAQNVDRAATFWKLVPSCWVGALCCSVMMRAQFQGCAPSWRSAGTAGHSERAFPASMVGSVCDSASTHCARLTVSSGQAKSRRGGGSHLVISAQLAAASQALESPARETRLPWLLL